MGNKQTPPGPAATKWETDPISAVHEHYHQMRDRLGGEKPQYSYSPGTCTLRVPYPEGEFVGKGRSRRVAKHDAATQASKALFT